MRDEAFIRGRVPMTKSEVRAISLAKLELGTDGVFYDIGAGTGSVAVEAALKLHHGRVYAIEQKEEACELILANREKFGLDRIKLVRGTAPDCMKELPAPDYVFIGGTGRRFPEIMKLLKDKNPAAGIVINVIALETLSQVVAWLNETDTQAEIISVQVAKAKQAADYHLMEGGNPVYVISIGGRR